jgi:hypothetical protein
MTIYDHIWSLSTIPICVQCELCQMCILNTGNCCCIRQSRKVSVFILANQVVDFSFNFLCVVHMSLCGLRCLGSQTRQQCEGMHACKWLIKPVICILMHIPRTFCAMQHTRTHTRTHPHTHTHSVVCNHMHIPRTICAMQHTRTHMHTLTHTPTHAHTVIFIICTSHARCVSCNTHAHMHTHTLSFVLGICTSYSQCVPCNTHAHADTYTHIHTLACTGLADLQINL